MTKTLQKKNQTQQSALLKNGTSRIGFAAMPHKKVEEIAHKGGQARAEELGHEGYVKLGRKGGQAHAKSHSQSGHSQTSKDYKKRSL